MSIIETTEGNDYRELYLNDEVACCGIVFSLSNRSFSISGNGPVSVTPEQARHIAKWLNETAYASEILEHNI